MATAVGVSATGNAEIDGLLSGAKWSGSITFSFPDAPSDYPASGYSQDNEPAQAGFAQAPAAMQAAINYAIALIQGYTNIQISYAGTGSADLQIAQSPAANPTSYAYYPGNYSAGGDIWFGTGYNYSGAKLGNYLFATALHELGHALGLKHSQETGGPGNVAVPYAHDNSEYSIMSYRSYAGAPLTGYTAETYGFSQTYMANDILALQTMYGANYNTQSGNTVYTWSATTGQMFINAVAQLAPGGGTGGSANRVFETIWDGNGIDAYDMSNYTTAVSINLNPGASSITSSTQLAYLGNGHYAAGNVYNAYLFNNDVRSLIENAIGGSGIDTIIGNAIANRITGGAGRDTMTGNGGADTFVFALGDSSPASGQHDLITDFTSGDLIDISAMGSFRFLGTSAFDGAANALNYSYNTSTGVTTLSGDINGDRLADFAIDLSGNVTIGAADLMGLQTSGTVLESFGSTSLTQVGSSYYLNGNSSGSGPQLKNGGAVVSVGQFNPWAPIAAEVTTSGYEVAWQIAGTQQFSIWKTDSSGNVTSYNTFLGTSMALKSLETNFHQDLNGDGVIGIPVTTTVMESFGSTSLTQVGANYYLNSISSGTGPVLKNGGPVVFVGQYGPWTPIAAEQTATGYEVAWQIAGTQEFSIWNTDSSGNVTSYSNLTGTSVALKSLETSFHQDLNGDGVIGVPGVPAVPTVIESFGSNSLTQIGSNYYLNSVSGGTGPQLKNAGAAVSVGQFDPWIPIAAEQTSTGYQVAWRIPGTQQFSIWNTDNSGNVTSYSNYSGTETALKLLETSFHQDLNGDGVIGTSAGQAAITSGLSSQTAPVAVASYASFTFDPGLGSAIVSNTASFETSVTDNDLLTALLNEAPSVQLRTLFDSTNERYQAIFDFGNHESVDLANIHLNGLHATGFIIH